jgi:hypothetical protein
LKVKKSAYCAYDRVHAVNLPACFRKGNIVLLQVWRAANLGRVLLPCQDIGELLHQQEDKGALRLAARLPGRSSLRLCTGNPGICTKGLQKDDFPFFSATNKAENCAKRMEAVCMGWSVQLRCLCLSSMLTPTKNVDFPFGSFDLDSSFFRKKKIKKRRRLKSGI